MGKTKKIQTNLLGGEKILYAASMHWGIFITPMIVGIIGALVFIYFHPIVGGAILLVDILPLINATILYSTTEYGVTNKRILAFYGLFTTDLMQIGHDKLESTMVEQSLLGQIFGYYTVRASGTGAGTIPIPFLSDGQKLKKVMDEILYGDDRAATVQKLEKALLNKKK